jgi:hypothetical protein
MILETAQMLSSAHHVVNPDNDFPIYRKTHVNHPCSVWARQSAVNYKWLTQLGLHLCDEYGFRYDKTHKTERVMLWLEANVPASLDTSRVSITPFALAMPEELRDVSNPIKSYRNYYLTKREGRLGTWKNRLPPPWWV